MCKLYSRVDNVRMYTDGFKVRERHEFSFSGGIRAQNFECVIHRFVAHCFLSHKI